MAVKSLFKYGSTVACCIILASNARANLHIEDIKHAFDEVISGVEVVASSIPPIVGEIVSATGHPEIGHIISDVGKITTATTTVIHDVEEHNTTKALQDALADASAIAHAAGDRKAKDIINSINEIVANKPLKLSCLEDVCLSENGDGVVVGDKGAMDQAISIFNQGQASTLSSENQQQGSN